MSRGPPPPDRPGTAARPQSSIQRTTFPRAARAPLPKAQSTNQLETGQGRGVPAVTPPSVLELAVEGWGDVPRAAVPALWGGGSGTGRGRRGRYSPLSSGSGFYSGSVAATRSSSTRCDRRTRLELLTSAAPGEDALCRPSPPIGGGPRRLPIRKRHAGTGPAPPLTPATQEPRGPAPIAPGAGGSTLPRTRKWLWVTRLRGGGESCARAQESAAGAGRG